ncbi:DoxX family protein [Streptomyces hainanensis]|uniref:DoxX family membrane protein n=1 Tax=Streptomyces hainanensis TaxID=402648 RepID=A0A4R4SBU3_9ACTN|nr:DoxX family protein [Streptomyces hainanensis]TDC60591.1 DoxX family membrane protein [Streptomyces hainanensis]
MAPFLFLLGGTAVLRLLGLVGVDALDAWQPAVRGGLALMLVVTGLAHFVPPKRGELVAMVPPRLPRAELLVTVTGALELVGAVGLLIPPVAPFAAAALALLMLAMFPANVSAARRGLPVTPLPTRIALQAVFVGAAVAAAL